MKRIFSFFLAGILLLSFSACSSASIIHSTVGGDLFRIETVEQYPLKHDPLVDQAAQEQDEDARPELSTHIENLEQYDVIFSVKPSSPSAPMEEADSLEQKARLLNFSQVQ